MPIVSFFKLVSLVFLSIVFISGCFKAPSPEVELRELRAKAEGRMFQDAKLAFTRSDYPEAILLFNRFIKIHRHSVYVLEAQWWLARSYEKSGNLRLALGHFQRLAKSAYEHPYRHKAGLRARSLSETLGTEGLSAKAQGMAIDWKSFEGKGKALLSAQLTQRKGAVWMINLGCPIKDLPRGNGVPEGRKHINWGKRLGQGLGPLIEDAYQAGQSVYLGISLPCLGVFATGEGDEIPYWHDWVFEPRLQKVRMSPYFSLHSAGYQTVVLDILTKLSEFHIAGIVFQEDVPIGPYQGLSPIAVKRFEEKFKIRLDPSKLFVGGTSFPSSQWRTGDDQDFGKLSYPDVFWKWAGWKSRERLRVMNGFMQSLRSRYPHLQFGIEIHPESLTNPVYALAMFSEDWVETAQAFFDFFVARAMDSTALRLYSNSGSVGRVPSQFVSRSLVEQMVDYLGTPKRVWVIQRKPVTSFGHESQESVHGSDQSKWPKGVGEIIDVSPVP